MTPAKEDVARAAVAGATKAKEHKGAIAGAMAGMAVAGPLGGLVGGVVGEASNPQDSWKSWMGGSSDSVFVTNPRTSLPCLGGGVAAVGLLLAGPAAAVGAGVVAAAGTYFGNLSRADKLRTLASAPQTARDAVSQVSQAARHASDVINSLWTPRLRGPMGEGDGAADVGEDAEHVIRAARVAKAATALETDGFALHPLHPSDDRGMLGILNSLLQTTDSKQLGKGKDAARSSPYDALRLATAWRIECPRAQRHYQGARQTIEEQMALLEARGALGAGDHLKGLPARTAQAAAGLAAQAGTPLSEAAAETMLLHGTSPDVLLSVLSNGLNERFSGSNAGTAFGDGVYLAEDVGKTDQYTSIDARYEKHHELHLRLYGKHHMHPGSVYYVLVCRVCLGYAARTMMTGRSARHMDTNEPLFPVSFRELAFIPNVTPPTTYHSLIAEL